MDGVLVLLLLSQARLVRTVFHCRRNMIHCQGQVTFYRALETVQFYKVDIGLSDPLAPRLIYDQLTNPHLYALILYTPLFKLSRCRNC